MTMNDDIKKFPVYALSNQGLVPIELSSTDDYNHYTHQLNYFINEDIYNENKNWYKSRDIKQKLILMPKWVNNEICEPKYSDEEFKQKVGVNRWDLLFNRRYSNYG